MLSQPATRESAGAPAKATSRISTGCTGARFRMRRIPLGSRCKRNQTPFSDGGEVRVSTDLPDLPRPIRGPRRLEGQPVGEHGLEDLAEVGLVHERLAEAS